MFIGSIYSYTMLLIKTFANILIVDLELWLQCSLVNNLYFMHVNFNVIAVVKIQGGTPSDITTIFKSSGINCVVAALKLPNVSVMLQPQ